MAIEVLMPRLSDTMEEGKLLRWLKKVGDKVEVGDIIAEVETDKADMEMEAIDAGVLAEIRGRPKPGVDREASTSPGGHVVEVERVLGGPGLPHGAESVLGSPGKAPGRARPRTAARTGRRRSRSTSGPLPCPSVTRWPKSAPTVGLPSSPYNAGGITLWRSRAAVLRPPPTLASSGSRGPRRRPRPKSACSPLR